MTDIHVLYPGRGVCDFCSQKTEQLRRYKCKTFNDPMMEVLSKGKVHATSVADWAACPACESLIEANKWDELANRSTEYFPDPVTDSGIRAILLDYMKGLHKQFRENRIQ